MISEFRRIELDTIDVLRPYTEGAGMHICDYTLGTMLLWRGFFKTEYTIFNGAMYTRMYDASGAVYYNLPMADDVAAATDALIEQLSEENEILFTTVPEHMLGIFEKYGGSAEISEQRDFFDYVYNTSDLAELKGKRYCGQRNLISQFKRGVQDWRVVPIDVWSLRDVREFYEELIKSSPPSSEFATAESDTVRDLLQNYDSYGMLGAVLYADSRVVGFSVGERVEDTLYVHVEKADRTVKGAYQMMVNSFAVMYGDGMEYINREEDMGDEGLRTAKLAYHPTLLRKKYVVKIKR